MGVGAGIPLTHQLTDPLNKEIPGLLEPPHHHGLDIFIQSESNNGFHLNNPHKILTMKINHTIILPVVLPGFETRFLTRKTRVECIKENKF
jgi:hypothetical protein